MLAILAAAAIAQPSPTPLVIAHRGASGYLPEHTLPAYALAYGQGADMIEPDVVLTKDDVVICQHDLTLERTTNVEQAFPDRKRADGRWYAVDFTWKEIQSLVVDGPRRPGEPLWNSEFRKTTLSAMIGMIRTLNSRHGRSVGIVPEPKSAAFHRENGKDLVRAVHRLLSREGVGPRGVPAVLQSFEPEALRQFAELGSTLPRVLLVSDRRALDAAGGLSEVRRFAMGIGPNKIFAAGSGGALISEARAAGLQVYVWTLGADAEEAARFFRLGVTGVFTDFPDVALRARASQ